MSRRKVQLYAGGAEDDRLVGEVYANGFGRRLTTTFKYAEEWLSGTASYALSPQLPLSSEACHAVGLHPFLQDMLPDRWGRKLIFRMRQKAAVEGAGAVSVDDFDYLVGVDDWARTGNLRLSMDGGRTFLGSNTNVPRKVNLPELLAASRSVMRGDEGVEELKELLDVGAASLGGARPKATILSDDGSYHIAKFPSPNDEWNVIKWEHAVISLARDCGIEAPDCELVHVGSSSVLLERRFDRLGETRVPFMSAMTLLGAADMEESDYYYLFDSMKPFVAAPDFAVDELLRRVMFSIAVHNTDDHLRNHGFIRDDDGWRLSPLYDVNPNPSLAEGRMLTVCGRCGEDEVDGLRELVADFSVSSTRALSALDDVLNGIRSWESRARRSMVPEEEIRMFAPVVKAGVRSLSAYRRELAA